MSATTTGQADGALGMPQVLRFLQAEWRSHERAATEWELERLELVVGGAWSMCRPRLVALAVLMGRRFDPLPIINLHQRAK